MKYALVILAALIQGILSKNCTRTNTKKNFCVKSCDPSLNNPCRGNRACLCDGDCGFSCVKTDRRCPKPRIENGRIRGARNTSFGSVIKYRCNDRYLLKGPRKRTCRGNGNWDRVTPVCKATCEDPGNIPHGRKQGNNYESGKKVIYTCPLGFIMQGNSTLTCKDNGLWNREKPKCVCQRTNEKAYRNCKKSCNPKGRNCHKQSECLCDGDCGYSCVAKGLTCKTPVQIENGNRQYTSTKFGSTVRYQCNKPYSLIGAETRTCRGIRRWDGIDPVCKIICQDPGDITHGSKQVFRRNYDEDYSTVGDRVEYNCFPTYKMEGSKQLICTKNGQWSGPKPKCTVPTCKPPQLPQNAELLRRFQSGRKSYNYKERVVLKCKTGYFSRGIGVKTCNSDGWTGSSFACSPKTCGHPGRLENGKITSYVFTFKSKVHFECNRRYKLHGDKFRQCQSNQQWSGRVPKCKLIDCGTLSTPAGASKVLATHTNVDGVVRFKCTEKGYEISGSDIRKCLTTGLWSGTTTTCKIISCADPGSPLDGKKVNVKSKYNYGDTLQFACNVNFTLAGKSKIKCEETKDWSGAVPYCRAPCSDPGVPNKGKRIDQDFRHGRTVRFTCPRNFVMDGVGKITCTEGQWNGDKPSCMAQCSDPGNPPNGRRSGKDFRHNRSVRFTCNTGFELKGNASITCLDGRWSGSNPQCEVISCAVPGSPTNGKIADVKNKYNYGDTLQFACNVNYTLEGDRQIKCEETKHWSGAVPHCRAMCSDPGIPGKGVRIGEAFSHNQTVRFTCHPGFEINGSEVITCLDGRWSGSKPTCKVCRDGNALGMSNGVIADSSIRASSEKVQHPARYGRLGGDSFWCSQLENKKYIEIDLPEKYKITKVAIDVQRSVNSAPVNLYTQILKGWVRFHREPRTVSVGYHEIVPSEPFMAESIRIEVPTQHRLQSYSLCLKAEIYGCGAPRGCIIPGSAVIDADRYFRGYPIKIKRKQDKFVFIYQSGSSTKRELLNRSKVILDEKPDLHKLTQKTLVLGKDIATKSIKKGVFMRLESTKCGVLTDDNVWWSDLNDVRLVKTPEFCPR